MKSTSLVFLSGKRTAFGAYGGVLKDVSPVDLGVTASKAALDQANVSPAQVDHVIFGSVLSSAPEAIYVPRHIGLKLEIPQAVPALGVNRLCGTGFQVIVEALHQMLAGDTEVALVGGVENMSMTPYALRGARWGMRMGHSQAIDMMTESLTDNYIQAPMAITAENLSEQYKIPREEVDAYALVSQSRCADAAKAGRFNDEIAPFSLKDRKGNVVAFAQDEHPKPETTKESLGKLKAIFKKDGVVTAGNASGIVDGAAAMVVATEERAKKEGWKPMGRLLAYGISGCDPKIMGIGPAPAIRQALKRSGLSLDQIDLIEVNEAFSAQYLAVEKELGLNDAKTVERLRERSNVNGGAIAIGHPLAASGTRIVQTLLYELRRQGKRYGIGSACIGGGQGIALVVEAL